MPEMKGTIDIGRPVEDVFAYLKDPTNNLEWEKNVVEMEFTSEGPISVGSTGRRVEDYMGREEGTWEITEYDENKVIAMKFESPKFTGVGSWQVESVEGGTRLEYRGDPKGFLTKLMIPIMMPMIKRQVKKDRIREVVYEASLAYRPQCSIQLLIVHQHLTLFHRRPTPRSLVFPASSAPVRDGPVP